MPDLAVALAWSGFGGGVDCQVASYCHTRVATTKASSGVVLQGLAEIRRGVKAPADAAAFMAWVLGVEAALDDAAGRLRFANGQLVYTSDPSPVSIGWNA